MVDTGVRFAAGLGEIEADKDGTEIGAFVVEGGTTGEYVTDGIAVGLPGIVICTGGELVVANLRTFTSNAIAAAPASEANTSVTARLCATSLRKSPISVRSSCFASFISFWREVGDGCFAAMLVIIESGIRDCP